MFQVWLIAGGVKLQRLFVEIPIRLIRALRLILFSFFSVSGSSFCSQLGHTFLATAQSRTQTLVCSY